MPKTAYKAALLVLHRTLGFTVSLFGLNWVGFKDWVGLWVFSIHVRIPQKRNLSKFPFCPDFSLSALLATQILRVRQEKMQNVQFLLFCKFCEVTFSDLLAQSPTWHYEGPTHPMGGAFSHGIGSGSSLFNNVSGSFLQAGTRWYKLVQAGTSSGTICYLPMLLANVLLNLLDNAKFLVRFKLVQMINRKRENKCQLCCLTQIYPNICQLSDIA